jgi:hypothetical protein
MVVTVTLLIHQLLKVVEAVEEMYLLLQVVQSLQVAPEERTPEMVAATVV